jgi:hypothetical protein
MTPSKTYLKFQETRSKEDLDTLNGYLLRLQQISVILNGDIELSNEEEHAEEIEYYLNFLEKPETLYTFTENTINFFKSLIK